MIDSRPKYPGVLLKKTYGLYWRNGKAYYRNYKHVLKSGKGLHVFEAIMQAEYANLVAEWKPLCEEV